MKQNKLIILALFFSLCSLSCNSIAETSRDSAKAAKSIAKAEKKISMAIGREIDEFTIVNQQTAEAPAGFNGIQYTVNTNDGETFKCEVLEPSGFGKVISFGTGTGTDAMCTAFTKGSKDRTTVKKESAAATKTNINATVNNANATKESAKAAKNRAKAEKKISMAIGHEIGEFTIASQQSAEAPAGFNGTQYTVNTTGGKTFKCEVLEPSGFGKAISFGTGTGTDAMCTEFTKRSKDSGSTKNARCNALLKAAGKC